MSAPSKFTSGATDLSDHREAALALLSRAVQCDEELPPREASFLGACVSYRTLTPKMNWWLLKLLRAAGLPSFERVQS